jgi:hypothetical protein
MSNDSFDDGLVHSHGWAAEPPRAHAAPRPAPITIRPHEHDEGLVHSHAWACGERGRMAHRT